MSDLRPPPFFIANSPALDFLNSIAVPVDTVVEWLTSGDDLLVWMQTAGFVPAEAARSIRRKASAAELDKVAGEARSLREWFRAFVDRHRGGPLKPRALQELDRLNRLLGRDRVFTQIVPQQGNQDTPKHKKPVSPFLLQRQRDWKTANSLLLPIAEAMAELVCNEDFADIKACEGPICSLLFIDRTRGSARRWCSMAVCGNRAKQAAHRERLQQDR